MTTAPSIPTHDEILAEIRAYFPNTWGDDICSPWHAVRSVIEAREMSLADVLKAFEGADPTVSVPEQTLSTELPLKISLEFILSDYFEVLLKKMIEDDPELSASLALRNEREAELATARRPSA